MAYYRVFLHGKNFHMKLSGKPVRYGFYTHRVVDAENEEEAELAAVDIIRKDDYLRSRVRNATDDPPMIYAEEIYEVGEPTESDAGYTFYS